MLDDELKSSIQQSYSQLLQEKGYTPRSCQKLMIAQIARTLGNIEIDEEGHAADPHIAVIEAGTGTGKTIAYALAAIPIAKARKKSLIISTATIALQEQIVYTDLPDIRQHAGLEFTFALAKGRRRYLCLARLDTVLQDAQSMNHSLRLYDDEAAYLPDEQSLELYMAMLERLAAGKWDGERDSWQAHLEDLTWNRVSTDHLQCTGRKCSHYDNCFFYKSRERLHRVDCIVTNHDLVLSDLLLGGGSVLPDPAEVIYIFDEGHHLPEKAINHFSYFTGLSSTRTWLVTLPRMLQQLAAESPDTITLRESGIGLDQQVDRLVEDLDFIHEYFRELINADVDLQHAASYGGITQYRFSGGCVSPEISRAARGLAVSFGHLGHQLNDQAQQLDVLLQDASGSEREFLEQWYPLINSTADRAHANEVLWFDYAQGDEADHPPRARWLNRREDADELQVNSSPVIVDQDLHKHLWQTCYAAVITSATLAIAGNFDRFRQRFGVGDGQDFLVLPSPFRFQERAVLQIPRMAVEPTDTLGHTSMIIEMMPALLASPRGALVLFASWRQMNQVLEALDDELRARILPQGELSKLEIIQQHKARVRRGEQSVIFGLASFAEGVDLPGELCEHVIIAKIPFAVPNDPVGATLGEWVERRGGNSFQELSIPDAILRLIQAGGRLMRTEQDHGLVTLLDNRVLTRRYGQQILAALPPFRRIFNEEPLSSYTPDL